MQPLRSVNLFCRSCLTATCTGMSVIPLMAVVNASGLLPTLAVSALDTDVQTALDGTLPLARGAVTRSNVTTGAPPV